MMIIYQDGLWLLIIACSQTVLCACQCDINFAAIKDVHAHVDNDHDGKIDRAESTDYMKTELEAHNNGRQSALHKANQGQISVMDLWNNWKKSEVYRWSNKDVIDWLVKIVELPEYKETFYAHKVDGKNMPRLATLKTNYQKELGISHPIHRKKIYLRASDAILFGAPDSMKKMSAVIDQNFLAIKAVHAHLDDDRDGNINVDESDEYMRDELKAPSSLRHSFFHNNDSNISVDELWQSWQQSEVYNWTNDEVIVWVKNTVGLPQYENNFREKKVDGKSIPSITTDIFLVKELGITNAKHRKKISLRASDVILFGAPDLHKNYFNDYVVLVIILVATIFCFYAFHEKSRTRKQIDQMSKDMESLQQAEDNLRGIQETLALAEERRQTNESFSSEREKKLLEEIETAKNEATRLQTERGKNQEDKIKLTLVEQELSEVRSALAKAELKINSSNMQSPKVLQQWLQMTYRKEAKLFQYKKQQALTQMEEAKEACEKVSKTRRSMFGSLRLAHGQSIDDVDHKILNARSALAEVTNDLQERQHRWQQIETLCNFKVVTDGSFHGSGAPNGPLQGKIRKSSIAQAIAEITSVGTMSFEPSIISQKANSALTTITGSSKLLQNVYTNEVLTEHDETDHHANGVNHTYCTTPDRRTSDDSVNSSNHERCVLSDTLDVDTSPIYMNENSFENQDTFIFTPSESSDHKRNVQDHKTFIRTSSDLMQPVPANRNIERYIHRASTEPRNISRMAFGNALNSTARLNNGMVRSNTERAGKGGSYLAVNPKQLSKSSECVNTENSDQNVFNNSSDNESYVSDESISSSVSSNISTKKRKGIRKLFSKRKK